MKNSTQPIMKPSAKSSMTPENVFITLLPGITRSTAMTAVNMSLRWRDIVMKINRFWVNESTPFGLLKRPVQHAGRDVKLGIGIGLRVYGSIRQNKLINCRSVLRKLHD